MNDPFTIEDLRKWPKAARSKIPIRLGVVGDPVAHSLSPQMQNAALEQAGLKMRYGSFHIRLEELEEALLLFREHGFVGLNLTLPHKLKACELMDEVDPKAREIGAVNTVVFRNERTIGHNTDSGGFERAIRHEFAVDLRDLRVLVLGAGGAGRAIAFQAAHAGCERLVIANRTREKADALAQELARFFRGSRLLGPIARLESIPLEESALRLQLEHIDLVVNTTSLGLHHNDPSPLPAHLLTPYLLIYDSVYPGKTPLMRAAADAGARSANGLSLLVEQGALSFALWFERDAPIEVMRKALL